MIEVSHLTQDKLQVLHNEKVDIQIQQPPHETTDDYVTAIIIGKQGDLGKMKKLLHKVNVTYSIIH